MKNFFNYTIGHIFLYKDIATNYLLEGVNSESNAKVIILEYSVDAIPALKQAGADFSKLDVTNREKIISEYSALSLDARTITVLDKAEVGAKKTSEEVFEET